MIAWYVICPVRYGKRPFGASRSKRTAFRPTFRTERITPLYEDCAWESGPRRRLNVATTSSAVIGLPSWNLTPRRSWNVHDLPPRDGFHDVARRGRKTAFLS